MLLDFKIFVLTFGLKSRQKHVLTCSIHVVVLFLVKISKNSEIKTFFWILCLVFRNDESK